MDRLNCSEDFRFSRKRRRRTRWSKAWALPIGCLDVMFLEVKLVLSCTCSPFVPSSKADSSIRPALCTRASESSSETPCLPYTSARQRAKSAIFVKRSASASYVELGIIIQGCASQSTYCGQILSQVILPGLGHLANVLNIHV